MKQMTRLTTLATIALVGTALAGCGAADNGEHSLGEQEGADASAQTAPTSVAEHIVAMNSAADHDLNLLVRKFLNDDTEAAEFYEPVPGRVLFSATGSPKGASVLRPEAIRGKTAAAEFYEPVPGRVLFSATGSPKGASVLRPEAIRGKTAAELWAVVAPGEAIPQALADAIARGNLPTSDLASSQPASAQRETSQTADFGAASPAPEGRMQLQGGAPAGYCTSQFWSDWKTEPGVYGQSAQISTDTWNYGWNSQTYTNVQWAAGFMACPLGNVSGTGGRLTVDLPNGTNAVFNLAPNYYRVETWVTGYNCGFDLSCFGTRCSPIGFNITGEYQSDCYLTKGTSCGDNYDWEAWWVGASSYCEN